MQPETDLLRPEAYGALRPQGVDLVETHLSRVSLLERDVFKLKRPVDLGFVDFTTLERREAACRAEVSLNTRLSEGVYLGVVPVRAGADGRASIAGEGPVVDWAVHMRRLPDARRGDVLLAKRELAPRDLDAVAERLARFHADATVTEAVSRFGSPEAISRNVEENFAQMRGALERHVTRGSAAEIARWQAAFVQEHGPLFRRRMATGRVRDGHGDLRLEHLYLMGGEPTFIDCIEFSDRFRFADVCADVAFFSMDLAAHGRVDLAERFLSRYARAADDFDLYALVDFYEGYRAMVRAKVSSFLASDDTVDPSARASAEASVRRHLLLAQSVGRRSLLEPIVVAVGGVIASGKSTVAARIGDAMSAPVVDADRTRKAMAGVAPNHPLHDGAWQGAYDPSVTERVYAEVVRRAGVILDSGRPVVLDASFRTPSMRAAARRLARDHGVPFRFVECRTRPEQCRERLAERARDTTVSDGRLEIFDAFRARFEPVTELSHGEHVVVDTSASLDETLDAVGAHVATWPKGLVA